MDSYTAQPADRVRLHVPSHIQKRRGSGDNPVRDVVTRSCAKARVKVEHLLCRQILLLLLALLDMLLFQAHGQTRKIRLRCHMCDQHHHRPPPSPPPAPQRQRQPPSQTTRHCKLHEQQTNNKDHNHNHRQTEKHKHLQHEHNHRHGDDELDSRWRRPRDDEDEDERNRPTRRADGEKPKTGNDTAASSWPFNHNEEQDKCKRASTNAVAADSIMSSTTINLCMPSPPLTSAVFVTLARRS